MRKNINYFVILSALIITLIFLYGNLVTKKGSIMDNAILNENDEYLLMDEKVKSLSKGGLKAGEIIPFIMKFDDKIININDLDKILKFNDELKKEFPGYGIMSIAEAVDYTDTGDEILNPKFIDNKIIHNQFNIDKWKDRVRNNKSVYGTLIGKDFEYAMFALYLPLKHDEIEIYRKVSEFIEKRKISPIEWLWKTDIEPAHENVLVAGWIIGRGLIDASLNVDIVTLTTVGLIITTFFLYLTLGSYRQALITTFGLVFLSILWVRGSIGILEIIGFDIRERVFALVAYTNCIVQGISFGLHSFETYNTNHTSYTYLSIKEVWDKVWVDLGEMLFLTTSISLIGFATLYSFQVLSIRELGILSGLGICYLWVLARYFLPSLHQLIGGNGRNQSSSIRNYIYIFTNTCIYYVIICLKSIPICLRIPISILILIFTTSTAVVLLSMDWLIVNTRPLEYIKDTSVYSAAQYLNLNNRVGFDSIEIVIEPINYNDIYNSDFILACDRYLNEIKENTKVREIAGIITTLKVISKESYGTEIPSNNEQVIDIFRLIESDTQPSLKEQLWFEKGIRTSLTINADNSNETGLITDSIIEMANKYKNIRVYIFGKTALYSRFDNYIKIGKPWNVINSEWMIFTISTLWILFNNKKINNKIKKTLNPFISGIVMSIPFLFSASIMLITMMTFKIPLDIATATITALAINASVDFSIYLFAEYQRLIHQKENKNIALYFALQKEGTVVLQDTILNVICFTPLLISKFSPVNTVGWILSFMLITCCIGTIFLMASCLPACVAKENS